MGRKSITQTTVVVQIDNETLVWTEGIISGTSKEYIATAKFLSQFKVPVSLTPFGPVIDSDLDDPEAPQKATAALMGVVPGRGILLQAPPEVLDLLPFENATDEDMNLLF